VRRANGPALQTVALRPHMIYGPQDQYVTTLVQQGRRGTTRFVIGGGDNMVDCCFVKNLVYAHLLAADKLAPAGSPCGGKVRPSIRPHAHCPAWCVC
jgi:nucleoside-diphosphate-sugar epimerase